MGRWISKEIQLIRRKLETGSLAALFLGMNALRGFGILRDEYESCELSWGPSQPGKCCCSKQCHQLVWNLLCHTTDWSLSSRFIFGKILDNCEFCYHIYRWNDTATLSASVTGLKPSCDKDSCHPTTGQTATCFVALYMIALGTGGIKPCVSSFGADQFDETDETERKRKSSFFNWFYLSINIGALVASSVLVWMQMNVGWGWGFGVPAVAMAVAVVFFFLRSKLYRIQKPGGSPITRIVQVIVASFRKSNVQVPADKSLLYETAEEESQIQGSRKLEHTNKFKFFDKAAVKTQDDNIKGSTSPWRLCTVTQVEELKSIIRLLPVWASGIVFSTVYSQMSTMFVLQGNTMDQHMGPHHVRVMNEALLSSNAWALASSYQLCP